MRHFQKYPSYFLFLAMLLPLSAQADWNDPGQLACDFNISAAPIASLVVVSTGDLNLIPPVKLNFSGVLKQLSVEEVPVANAQELKRYYFSKEDPPNSAILVLMKQDYSATEKRAIFINPNFTVGDRIGGQCSLRLSSSNGTMEENVF